MKLIISALGMVRSWRLMDHFTGGKHLGTIIALKHPHNLTWGGNDGKTLYMTARDSIYRMPLNIPGIRPADGMPKLAAQR